MVIHSASGSTTSATRVSSGDSHSMATSDTTKSTQLPSASGTIDSRPCTSLQVGDRPGHHLPGAQRVLPLAVEPLDGGEDLTAQVVLHVEREPAAEEPPQERGREPHDGEPEERGDDGPERGRGARHRLVDRRPGEQRPHRIEAHPQRRRHQSGDRHRAVAHRGADEAADPAGGGSVVHGLHVKPTDFSRE